MKKLLFILLSLFVSINQSFALKVDSSDWMGDPIKKIDSSGAFVITMALIGIFYILSHRKNKEEMNNAIFIVIFFALGFGFLFLVFLGLEALF